MVEAGEGRHPCGTYSPQKNMYIFALLFGGYCQWGGGTGVGGYCRQGAGVSCSTLFQMWGSWYLSRFLFKGGSLTLMNIASLVVLVKHCDSLPTMEKLSNVMLCPVVWKWSKMGERALRCSLYLFNKTSAYFSYVFHVASRLITSVPVKDLPFLDDVVFVLGS